jgi:hypothetical protein
MGEQKGKDPRRRCCGGWGINGDERDGRASEMASWRDRSSIALSKEGRFYIRRGKCAVSKWTGTREKSGDDGQKTQSLSLSIFFNRSFNLQRRAMNRYKRGIASTRATIEEGRRETKRTYKEEGTKKREERTREKMVWTLIRAA